MVPPPVKSPFEKSAIVRAVKTNRASAPRATASRHSDRSWRALAEVVRVFHVVEDHPRRRELRADAHQGPLDHGDPAAGYAVRVAVVEERHDLVVEDVEEDGGIALVLDVGVKRDLAGQPPAVGEVESLRPPAVQRGEV